jgi:hypothetical protein
MHQIKHWHVFWIIAKKEEQKGWIKWKK